MPWRSRAMALTRSARSVCRPESWVSSSVASASARRLTGPIFSRSRTRRWMRISVCSRSGSSSPGSSSAMASASSGAQSRRSRMRSTSAPRASLAWATAPSARTRASRAAARSASAALQGAVGGGQRRLGLGQAVGRLAPLGRGLLDQLHQRLALGGDLRRAGAPGSRSPPRWPGGAPPGWRAGAPPPRRAVARSCCSCGDGAQALAPGLRLAAQALARAAAFDEMAALLGQRRLQLAEAARGPRRVGQIGERSSATAARFLLGSPPGWHRRPQPPGRGPQSRPSSWAARACGLGHRLARLGGGAIGGLEGLAAGIVLARWRRARRCAPR